MCIHVHLTNTYIYDKTQTTTQNTHKLTNKTIIRENHVYKGDQDLIYPYCYNYYKNICSTLITKI